MPTQLSDIGQQIRLHRKSLNLSTVCVAEAAGLSRVTLYRIEKGEPSVTMGAYLNVLKVLNLSFSILLKNANNAIQQSTVNSAVKINDYPQLKLLAWHIQGIDSLTPSEAANLYERNWRYIDKNELIPEERELIKTLKVNNV